MIRSDFCGAGGMMQGLVQAGVNKADIVGYEKDPAAAATARAAGFTVVEGDLREAPAQPLDGYTAGPPCQTFTVAGAGSGRKALDSLIAAMDLVAKGDLPIYAVRAVYDEELDERSVLVLEPLRVIRRDRPRWVILEQVPSVLPIWEAYVPFLEKLGYTVSVHVWKSEQYGVPQTRRRASLVAVLDRPDLTPADLTPAPTHSQFHSRDKGKLDPGVLPWVSMAQALGRGMTARPSMTVMGGGTATGGAEPFGNGSRQGMLKEIEAGRWIPMAAPDADWVNDRPNPTIVGSFAPDVVAAPGYRKAGDPPRQKTPGSVRITLEEASVLQSFPADWPWQGTNGQRFQQVGNAVPPRMAEVIARHLLGL